VVSSVASTSQRTKHIGVFDPPVVESQCTQTHTTPDFPHFHGDIDYVLQINAPHAKTQPTSPDSAPERLLQLTLGTDVPTDKKDISSNERSTSPTGIMLQLDYSQSQAHSPEGHNIFCEETNTNNE
jgi:hypothetical protein